MFFNEILKKTSQDTFAVSEKCCRAVHNVLDGKNVTKLSISMGVIKKINELEFLGDVGISNIYV